MAPRIPSANLARCQDCPAPVHGKRWSQGDPLSGPEQVSTRPGGEELKEIVDLVMPRNAALRFGIWTVLVVATIFIVLEILAHQG
jgi:hypothetical protein